MRGTRAGGTPQPWRWSSVVILAACLALFQARSAAGQTPTDTTILPPQELGTIQLGQLRSGMLEAGDYTMSDGTWADIWYFTAAAGQRLVIEARARQFAAYLQLLDPWGNKLAEDAGGGERGAARITFSTREAGRYQIVVNNYSETPQAGNYSLTVR